MAAKTPNAKRLKAQRKRDKETLRYLELFQTAFDELHDAVVKKVKSAGQYVGPHHDYPIMSALDSGFPSFFETGFYRDESPRNYLRTLTGTGLAGALGYFIRPDEGFPKGAELATFLRNHDIGKRIDLDRFTFEGRVSDGPVDRLVGTAVERYLHLFGLDAAIDAKRRNSVILPLIFGTIWRDLNLRLVVPIALTHFEADHFRLSETTYIARLPEKLQLSRARMNTHGSGAVKGVVGAATHAFVSKDWHLSVDSIYDIGPSLTQTSANVIDDIDSFFGALRVATGISTGYAQILWMPKRWALDYFCDLTPVFGTTIRQYPSEYDDYGWSRKGDSVSLEQLKEMRRIYQAIVNSNSEAVRLALMRLNRCLTRDDEADAILDGTIGLELLLGDDQNQSLAFKLRLRAGALANLQADPAYLATDIASKVKKLYGARSSIVHGSRKKRSKKATEPIDTSHAQERELASDLLRFVLDMLLTHPEYLNPTKIDNDLLLGSNSATVTPKPAQAPA